MHAIQFYACTCTPFSFMHVHACTYFIAGTYFIARPYFVGLAYFIGLRGALLYFLGALYYFIGKNRSLPRTFIF